MQVAAEQRSVVPAITQIPARRSYDVVRLAARYPRVVVFGAIIVLLVLIGVFAPLSPYDPIQTSPAHVYEQPSPAHWLGTDNVGRDQFTRVLYGTRISLGVAVIAVTIALTF